VLDVDAPAAHGAVVQLGERHRHDQPQQPRQRPGLRSRRVVRVLAEAATWADSRRARMFEPDTAKSLLIDSGVSAPAAAFDPADDPEDARAVQCPALHRMTGCKHGRGSFHIYVQQATSNEPSVDYSQHVRDAECPPQKHRRGDRALEQEEQRCADCTPCGWSRTSRGCALDL